MSTSLKIGMLVFDDGDCLLQQKVQRAARRYVLKYGEAPNLVFVNPLMRGDEDGDQLTVRLDGKPHVLTLKQARSILPHHLWLGVAQSAHMSADIPAASVR